jgi:hypothetical protein
MTKRKVCVECGFKRVRYTEPGPWHGSPRHLCRRCAPSGGPPHLGRIRGPQPSRPAAKLIERYGLHIQHAPKKITYLEDL